MELPRVGPVQVAHRGGQHDDVAGRKAVPQDQLSHRGTCHHQTHPDGNAGLRKALRDRLRHGRPAEVVAGDDGTRRERGQPAVDVAQHRVGIMTAVDEEHVDAALREEVRR